MKNTILFLALALIGFSCEKEPLTTQAEITLKFYAIHACGQETDLRAETPAEWGDRIADLVADEGIEVLSYEMDFEEQDLEGPFCGNCTRSGDVVKVTTPLTNESALRDFGFVDN